MIRQVSVFLENREGRLFEVTSLLAENGIDLRALSVADTKDFGVLRLVVSEPDKAFEILKNAGYSVRFTDVVVVAIPDRPGGLAHVLGILHKNKLNVEYMYTLVATRNDEALLVIRFDDGVQAEKILKREKVVVLDEATVLAR